MKVIFSLVWVILFVGEGERYVIFYANISLQNHASILFSFGLLLVDGFLRVQNFDDIWKRVVVMWTHLQFICYQLPPLLLDLQCDLR